MQMPIDEIHYVMSAFILIMGTMITSGVVLAVRDSEGRWILTGLIMGAMTIGTAMVPPMSEHAELMRETDAGGYDLVAKAGDDCRIRPLVAIALEDRMVNRGEVIVIRRRSRELARTDARDRLNRTPRAPCRAR